MMVFLKLTTRPTFVGQFAFFEDLQKAYSTRPGWAFFDFIEEHNRVGLASHLFG